MTTTPRLTLACAREGERPTRYAGGLIRACAREGISVTVLVVGADRDQPGADEVAELVEASGHAVHRIDPELMPAPSIQAVVARAAACVDLTMVLAFGVAIDGDDEGGRAQQRPALLDVVHTVGGPLVLCAHEGTHADAARPLPQVLRETAQFFTRRRLRGVPSPILWLVAAGDEDSAVNARSIEGLEAFVQCAADGRAATVDAIDPLEVPTRILRGLIDHALLSPPLPPPAVHTRRRVRARVGLVLDECFDLYDEESLVQFEMAGAELVPVPAIARAHGAPGRDRPTVSEGALDELDGLFIGDGHVERFSASLSASRAFRSAVRAFVGRGAPTIACGGGFAYLTRGLRTGGGALHPLAGVIGAESVVVRGPLPRGHVEVETSRETVIGAKGSRLRGYVQRGWLVRGAPGPSRGIYRTVSGPPDSGYGSANLAVFHFRPYWPSCPDGVSAFVDRCVTFAAAREFGMRGNGTAVH